MAMSKEDLFAKIKENLVETLELDVDHVTLETNIVEDLGADSISLMEFTLALEDEFGIEISLIPQLMQSCLTRNIWIAFRPIFSKEIWKVTENVLTEMANLWITKPDQLFGENRELMVNTRFIN